MASFSMMDLARFLQEMKNAKEAKDQWWTEYNQQKYQWEKEQEESRRRYDQEWDAGEAQRRLAAAQAEAEIPNVDYYSGIQKKKAQSELDASEIANAQSRQQLDAADYALTADQIAFMKDQWWGNAVLLYGNELREKIASGEIKPPSVNELRGMWKGKLTSGKNYFSRSQGEAPGFDPTPNYGQYDPMNFSPYRSVVRKPVQQKAPKVNVIDGLRNIIELLPGSQFPNRRY
jgi:hypothetical protein